YINGTRRESLYERVENLAEIKEAEFNSENWKHQGVGKKYEYIVLEQLTSKEEPTGYIKVVPRSKAIVKRGFFISTQVEARIIDCMYFKRRTGK
ncbi:MAG: hypothetical protein K6A90_07035, partial [Lachnospiraceae bacterium]|nr:hypothetical protein [Lachnospiraceae bacterium]